MLKGVRMRIQGTKTIRRRGIIIKRIEKIDRMTSRRIKRRGGNSKNKNRNQKDKWNQSDEEK